MTLVIKHWGGGGILNHRRGMGERERERERERGGGEGILVLLMGEGRVRHER